MIGPQPTGAIAGVVMTAVVHEGVRVFVDGEPGSLAVLDARGNIVSSSHLVPREFESVVINMHRNVLEGRGHLRVMSKPAEVQHG